MEGQHAQSLLEAAIVPALSGFALVVGVIAFTAWRPAPRPPAWAPLDRRRAALLVRRTAGLVLAGYAVFLLIVLVFSELLQHEPQGLPSAWWSGPFLLTIAVPVWVLLTWAFDRLARRRR
ncbi:MAG: DUF6256 family protein [Planctomycetaceae bacterium]